MSFKLSNTYTLDDTTYRLDELERVYKAWTPLMWTSREIYRLDEKLFVNVSRSPLLHESNHGDVKIITQLEAIEDAIRMNAPDDILREMSVTIHESDTRPKDTLHTAHPGTTLIASANTSRIHAHNLYRNYDGAFIESWLVVISALSYGNRWERRLSQREAISFTLKNLYYKNALEVLGISPA